MKIKSVAKIMVLAALSAGAGWLIRGFTGGPPGMPSGRPSMPPAAVNAQVVKEEYIQPADEYIARVEPVQEVLIRSEVSGYIDAVHFKEGSRVEEGDLLFTIDRRSYQATADAAEAERVRAQRLYDRMKRADERSVSASDLEAAESALLRAQAAFNLAKVSLDYTEIRAPVSGRIGAANLTKGNYVTSASGPLARIVQTDPVRAVFSMTDRDYLSMRREEAEGNAAKRIARLRLPDGFLLPREGKKEFDDNVINPETGTITIRYLFDNPDGLLIPGGYVTAILENSDREKGIKIPQRALLMDRDGLYVLTLNEQDEVLKTEVVPGPQTGTEMIIRSGLNPGDRLVVDGVQNARPGAPVQVNMMPEEDQ